jgi:hypothetical protein
VADVTRAYRFIRVSLPQEHDMKSNDQRNPEGTQDKIQGEGDYEAARRYDKSARDFAQSGKVKPAADQAAPRSEREADELERAEEIGKSRAKGEDPQVKR